VKFLHRTDVRRAKIKEEGAELHTNGRVSGVVIDMFVILREEK